MLAKLQVVRSVMLHISEGPDAEITIVATGQVPTSNWGSGHLAPWTYVKTPEDGIQVYEFLAEAPAEPPITDDTGEVIAMIKHLLDDWVKGIRVVASTNSIEKALAEVVEVEIAGGEVPWPLAGILPRTKESKLIQAIRQKG